jgi:hypothetical protein
MVTPFRTLIPLAAGLLAACTVIVEEPRPVPRPGVACTFEYAPVCGRRGDRERTFSNACLARVEGFRVVHRGRCTRTPVRPSACTLEYDPVCGIRGNRRQTMANACEARAGGFRILHRGRCR